MRVLLRRLKITKSVRRHQRHHRPSVVHASGKPRNARGHLLQGVAIALWCRRGGSERADAHCAVIRDSMNSVRCGIIGGKVRGDVGAGDIRKLIDPQSFQLLDQDLVGPDLFLGQFY